MNNPTISIVVPIYNVEKFLPRCLDSIIAQTYKNTEILLIDDASPDNAGLICDNYAASDHRIKVFHTPNGGVARARQIGVENSTGEYIIFVDSDDWLPLNSVEVLYSNIDNSVDIVVGSYSICRENRTRTRRIKREALSADQWIKRLLIWPKTHSGSPWCKLYRRSLFGCDSFPNMRRSQDWLMNLEVSMRSTSVKVIPEVTYMYEYPAGTQRYNPDLEYRKEFSSVAMDILQRNNKYIEYQKEYYLMQLSFVYDLIGSGNRITIDNDAWVLDLYNSLKDKNITLRRRFHLFAIRNMVAQFILMILIKIKKRVKRTFLII